ncbi:MAG: hypothetical protein K2Y32_20565 [Candidatus Obscuribacterales bacterium]|nr:hypothetical protein [Candidatus Obscuribacterales bacterium]
MSESGLWLREAKVLNTWFYGATLEGFSVSRRIPHRFEFLFNSNYPAAGDFQRLHFFCENWTFCEDKTDTQSVFRSSCKDENVICALLVSHQELSVTEARLMSDGALQLDFANQSTLFVPGHLQDDFYQEQAAWVVNIQPDTPDPVNTCSERILCCNGALYGVWNPAILKQSGADGRQN